MTGTSKPQEGISKKVGKGKINAITEMQDEIIVKRGNKSFQHTELCSKYKGPKIEPCGTPYFS